MAQNAAVRLGGMGDAVKLNQELDATLNKIKKKCEILGMKLKENEQKKTRLIIKIENATKRHQRVTSRLENRRVAKKEYEKTLTQTESAYKKIVDSSSTLLEVLKVQAGDSDPEDIAEVGTVFEKEKRQATKESEREKRAELTNFSGYAAHEERGWKNGVYVG